MSDNIPVPKKFLERLIKESPKIEEITNDKGFISSERVYSDAFPNSYLTIFRNNDKNDWSMNPAYIVFIERFYEDLLKKSEQTIDNVVPPSYHKAVVEKASVHSPADYVNEDKN